MGDPAPQPASRQRLVLAATAAVLALVVVVVWLLVRDGDDEGASGPNGPSPSSSTSESPGKTPTDGSSTGSPKPSKTPTKLDRKIIRTTFEEPEVELGNGVAVDVTDIEAVKGEARGPGEVAGPALRFTIRVTNDTRDEINLDLAVVVVYFGAKNSPAGELSGPGVVRLPQTLAAGKSASGKYVFRVPVDRRDRVRVDFSYTIEAPKVIFTGPAPS